MNDLQLLDKFCETCLDFINPSTFREIENRGLLWVVNIGLPDNILEAKAVVRARLAKAGKAFGDPEIDHIANEIKRLEALRLKLTLMNMADAPCDMLTCNMLTCNMLTCNMLTCNMLTCNMLKTLNMQ